jgi:hypothetical protein
VRAAGQCAVDALWQVLSPLGAQPGSDVRSFMGLVSLAELSVVRVAAMRAEPPRW